MLARLLLKFTLLVVATFLFVVLYDNGPTDFGAGMKRHLEALLAALQSDS